MSVPPIDSNENSAYKSAFLYTESYAQEET